MRIVELILDDQRRDNRDKSDFCRKRPAAIGKEFIALKNRDKTC